jgi:hypothetical protein
MTDESLSEWVEKVLEESNDPGAAEYLEVVERAEESSKRVEGYSQISDGNFNNLSLRSNS